MKKYFLLGAFFVTTLGNFNVNKLHCTKITEEQRLEKETLCNVLKQKKEGKEFITMKKMEMEGEKNSLKTSIEETLNFFNDHKGQIEEGINTMGELISLVEKELEYCQSKLKNLNLNKEEENRIKDLKKEREKYREEKIQYYNKYMEVMMESSKIKIRLDSELIKFDNDIEDMHKKLTTLTAEIAEIEDKLSKINE